MSIDDEIKKIDERYQTPPPSDEALLNSLRLNAATRSDIQIAANWTRIIALVIMWSMGLSLVLLMGTFFIGLSEVRLRVEMVGVALGLLVIVGILVFGIFLGRLLLDYSKALKVLTTHERPYGLAQFFQKQNRYWRTVGIFTVASIAFYILLLIIIRPILSGQSI